LEKTTTMVFTTVVKIQFHDKEETTSLQATNLAI